MTIDKLIYRGLDGETIKTGDLVAFSYGIPPVRVEGPVSVKDGQLYMATPGHGPGGGFRRKCKQPAYQRAAVGQILGAGNAL
jgi:hypothetical protein